jgi:hypothetical protein
MFQIILKHYGSNGSTCHQAFLVDTETQQDIVKLFQEYEESRAIDYPDNIIAGEISDKVLSAGGMATQLISISHNNKLVEPTPAVKRLFGS